MIIVSEFGELAGDEEVQEGMVWAAARGISKDFYFDTNKIDTKTLQPS